jgi:hypothetical protein
VANPEQAEPAVTTAPGRTPAVPRVERAQVASAPVSTTWERDGARRIDPSDSATPQLLIRARHSQSPIPSVQGIITDSRARPRVHQPPRRSKASATCRTQQLTPTSGLVEGCLY